MIKLKPIVFVFLFFCAEIIGQKRPQNAILKDFKPFETPRTNGRPGEVFRINENGIKYIVQDVKQIKVKTSEEGDLIGRMYFTADELLSLLNLEFDRLEIIPAEVKIVKAKREYNEQTNVDKVLYEGGKIRELIVDPNSSYYLIREAVLSKLVTFNFSHETVKKIKKGANYLTKVGGEVEVDFPFSIQKKFKKEKRIFYLDQEIKIEPYEE